MVRVAILQEVPSARVTISALCRLTDLSSGALIQQWSDLKWQQVEPSPPGLKIGRTQIKSTAVLLEPLSPKTEIRINSRPYRGSLIFYRTASGRLTVVNRLDLEEYLVGALGSEVSPEWPIEALKAHAVVSRTMVAHRIWIQRDRPFDITADTATHIYHGISAERETTRAAVDATRGQVLAFDGELFSASFHANCGGHTEDASQLWDLKREVPPLKGVVDPYCRDLKHFRWSTHMPMRIFLDALGPVGKNLGNLKACEIVSRNRSGRAQSVRLIADAGEEILTGRQFRELLGANRLRSLNFTAQVTPRGILFSGFGWGHGVGLCQWGAYGMATEGFTMDEILDFYFPGALRRPLAGLPGFTA